MNLQQTDPAVYELIEQEQRRQETTLELIASENHVSAAVMEAAGSVLTNKYAEGYPGARYYGGGPVFDQGRETAVRRGPVIVGFPPAHLAPLIRADTQL